MVIACISLGPMDWVEKYPSAKETELRSKKKHTGLGVFRSWEMSWEMFGSWGNLKLALSMEMVSDDFPTSR